MKYGIDLEWDGKLKARPSFMPKSSMLPSECNKCFFCKNGFTNGITCQASKKAKVTVEYKCATRVTTNKCEKITERVSLGMKSGVYCRMWCYRKHAMAMPK